MEPLTTITNFLQFLETPPEDQDRRIQELERHLDRLAWVRHDLGYDFDPRQLPDPPEHHYDTDRAVLQSRFPELGCYNTVSSVKTDLAETEVWIGDAMDDITDIYSDLKTVLWCWQQNSREDAIFHMRTLMPHWMGHVRGLQSYLSGDWVW